MSKMITILGAQLFSVTNPFQPPTRWKTKLLLAALMIAVASFAGCKKKEKNWSSNLPGIEADTTTVQAISENGGSTTFTVQLLSKPKKPVALDVAPKEPTRLQVGAADCGAATELQRLTFDKKTWDTPQTVTVCGLNNHQAENNISSLITITPVDGVTEDLRYLELVPVEVTIAIQDDDVPAVIVNAATVAPISEVGGKTDFTVGLSTEPIGSVEVVVTSPDTTEVLVSADNCVTKGATASVLLSSSSWTGKTISACGAGEDLTPDGDQAVSLTSAVSSNSTDPAYVGLTGADVVVTAKDFSKVYVRASDGADTNPGSATQPLATIQAGIAKAISVRDTQGRTVDVAVAAGVYNTDAANNNRIHMQSNVNLFGGFSATDWTVRESPRIVSPTHVTTIQDVTGTPLATGNMIQANAIGNNSLLEGFNVVGFDGDDVSVISILNSSPTIRDNVITGGVVNLDAVTGIFLNNGSPIIENNTIVGGTGAAVGVALRRGYGINATIGGAPVIRNNKITSHNGTGYKQGTGVLVRAGVTPTITGNTITVGDTVDVTTGISGDSLEIGLIDGNTINVGEGTNNSYGISLGGLSGTFTTNIITVGDNTLPHSGNLFGINLIGGTGSRVVSGNQVTAGTANGGITGIAISNGTELVMEDNIVSTTAASSASYGITISTFNGPATLRRNTATSPDTTAGTGTSFALNLFSSVGPNTIEDNTFTGGPTGAGSSNGMKVTGNGLIVRNNKAFGGGSTSNNYGIDITATSTLEMTGNIASVKPAGTGSYSYAMILRKVTTSGLIANNIFYGAVDSTTPVDGMYITGTINNLLIANNTIFGNGTVSSRALSSQSSTLTNVEVINNLLQGGNYCVYTGAGILFTTLDYNNLFGCTNSYFTVTGGINDVVGVDPGLSNPLGPDGSFNLWGDNEMWPTATSPASVQTGGMDLSADFDTDFAGDPRSGNGTTGWSKGAYEY